MAAKELELAFKIAEAELVQKIGRLKEKLTLDIDPNANVLSLAEIEELWEDFNSSSSKIFADLLVSYLRIVDEQVTVSVKKKPLKNKTLASKSIKKVPDSF